MTYLFLVSVSHTFSSMCLLPISRREKIGKDFPLATSSRLVINSGRVILDHLGITSFVGCVREFGMSCLGNYQKDAVLCGVSSTLLSVKSLTVRADFSKERQRWMMLFTLKCFPFLKTLVKDSGWYSSQLSATARAFYPSYSSRASHTSVPRAIPAINFPAPLVEHVVVSNLIAPHIPLLPFPSGAIIPFQNGADMIQPLPGATGVIINAPNPMQQTPAPLSVPPRRPHPDERTLFMTFSNGSLLSEDELLDFFLMHYGSDVESIYIEEPNTARTPHRAHITFHCAEMVGFVLNGEAKQKFRANGKHYHLH